MSETANLESRSALAATREDVVISPCSMTTSQNENDVAEGQSVSKPLLDFAYSLDDERYTDFESIVDEVNSDYPAGKAVIISKGEKIQYSHSDFINIDVFFELLNEAAYEECGEYGEDYMCKVDKEKRDELKKIISEWLGENFEAPNFFTVKNITKMEVVAVCAPETK